MRFMLVLFWLPFWLSADAMDWITDRRSYLVNYDPRTQKCYK